MIQRKHVRRFVESLGKLFGVIVIPEWRAAQLDEERHLLRLFEYLDVDCVLDVGANTGQYARMLRDYIGYSGRIVSFEPNPAPLEQLRIHASRDPLWRVEPFALGSKPGFPNLNAYSLSELASFHSLKNTADGPQGVSNRAVSVEMQILETYLDEATKQWEFKRPFLKLDTQGFDIEIAKGAGESLRDFVGIQSEIAFKNIYDDAPDYLSSINFFQSHGFVISRLCPIHEIRFPELLEMDLILIRNDLIGCKM